MCPNLSVYENGDNWMPVSERRVKLWDGTSVPPARYQDLFFYINKTLYSLRNTS